MQLENDEEEQTRRIEERQRAFLLADASSEEEENSYDENENYEEEQGGGAVDGSENATDEDQEDDTETIIRCEICRKDFKSDSQLDQHMASKNHKKKVKEMEKDKRKIRPQKNSSAKLQKKGQKISEVESKLKPQNPSNKETEMKSAAISKSIPNSNSTTEASRSTIFQRIYETASSLLQGAAEMGGESRSEGSDSDAEIISNAIKLRQDAQRDRDRCGIKDSEFREDSDSSESEGEGDNALFRMFGKINIKETSKSKKIVDNDFDINSDSDVSGSNDDSDIHGNNEHDDLSEAFMESRRREKAKGANVKRKKNVLGKSTLVDSHFYDNFLNAFLYLSSK